MTCLSQTQLSSSVSCKTVCSVFGSSVTAPSFGGNQEQWQSSLYPPGVSLAKSFSGGTLHLALGFLFDNLWLLEENGIHPWMVPPCKFVWFCLLVLFKSKRIKQYASTRLSHVSSVWLRSRFFLPFLPLSHWLGIVTGR